MNKEMVEITAEVKAETDRAFLLSNDDENEQWVPKSKMDHSSNPQVGDTIVFEIPLWLAIQKEFV